MHRLRDPLVRLLLGAALSLPLCLGLWWWALREPLAQGFGVLLDHVSAWLWPDTIIGLRMQGSMGLLITLLSPLTDPPGLFMTLPMPLHRASVILPLFWGLTLATPGPGLLRRLVIGSAILLPVAFVMILLYAQFELALCRTHLPLMTEKPPAVYALALPDSPVWYHLSGLGRQLAVLVLPVVAPLLTWLLLHWLFLRTVILGGWLQRAVESNPKSSPSVPLDPEA